MCCRYVGRLFVKSSGKPHEILEKLKKMAGFAPDEEIELYEVCVSTIFYRQLLLSLLCGLWLVALFKAKFLVNAFYLCGPGNKV